MTSVNQVWLIFDLLIFVYCLYAFVFALVYVRLFWRYLVNNNVLNNMM